MKKIILILTLILMANFAAAAETQKTNCGYQDKCIELMTTIYNDRATLYNVLNLSYDQIKCKDVIELKRYDELGVEFKKYEQEKYVLSRLCEHNASKEAIRKQKKVVNDIEKCMQKINQKYDKEFKSVLNSEQKSKLNSIRKIEKKEVKRCQKNKPLYKQDPNLRPFGEKMYSPENQKLCPVHKKWHLFGYKHKK